MNTDLRRAFACAGLDLQGIRSMLDEAKRLELTLDSATLEFALRGSIEKIASEFGANPTDSEAMTNLGRAVNLARSLPFEVQLWNAQNVYYEVLGRLHPGMHECAAAGDPWASAWVREFGRLGSDLMFAPMQ